MGRYIALGPSELRGNALAHEFGHLLGFIDRYARGMRNLGDAGYEILEIVPDPLTSWRTRTAEVCSRHTSTLSWRRYADSSVLAHQ